MKLKNIQAKLIKLIPTTTHALAALVPLLWWSALQGYFSPPLIIGAIIIGNLPDMDTATSHIGQLVYPIAKRIESHFGHRTITHSLLALAVVALLSFGIHTLISNLIPELASLISPWWWWSVFYVSHLLLDMLVGGATAVPLLWPSKQKFWFGLNIPAKSTGERVVFGILFAAGVVPLFINPTALNPGRLIRQSTGSVEMALYDYRQWEATNIVELEIEGTWQTQDKEHLSISGRFPIRRVEGSIFYLRDPETGTIFSAGQFGTVDVYITRAVAHKAESRIVQANTPTPGPSPTPRYLIIRVDGITDAASQILVHPGDHIQPGVTLAIPPTAAPAPTATPWTPDPFILVQAESNWTIAQAQHALDTAWRPIEETTILYAQATVLQIQAQIVELEIRINEGKAHTTAGLEALKIRLSIAEGNLAQLEESHGTGPTWQQRQLANAKLERARLTYSATIATATPAPTSTPVPVHVVDAPITGQIVDIQIAAVDTTNNTVVIDIRIMVTDSDQVLDDAVTTAIVSHVSDGDTLDVTWPSGATARIRLIGVDTPETTFPPEGEAECYGPKASDYTKSLLPEGSDVTLRYDRQRLDPYGRTLAYVYLDTGQMLNAALLENGYARVLIVQPNDAYADLFYSLEDQAKANQTGLWGACPEPVEGAHQ
ncbi:MAG: hypothetical protein GY832_32545 [Chloroflexi bacterium]|nr:hypothetical protein [Chloroflexota bacterium]